MLPAAVAAALAVAVGGARASSAEPCVPEPMPTGYSEQVPPDAAAVVAGEPVPRADVDAILKQARATYKRQKRRFPAEGTPAFRNLQSGALGFLVTRVEFEQVAVQWGIELRQAEIDRRLAEIKRQFFGGSEARFQVALKQNGLTLEQVLEDIRAQLLSERLFEAVTACIHVSESQARAYYRSHRDQYSRPERRVVRHILVKTRELADRLYRQLKAGARFASLARRYSLDPGSKSVGGRLTIVRGQTVPAFDRAAFALKKGELSQPVETQFGWHLIEALSAVLPSSRTPYDEVREQILQQLLSAERTAAITAWQLAVHENWEPTIFYARDFKP